MCVCAHFNQSLDDFIPFESLNADDSTDYYVCCYFFLRSVILLFCCTLLTNRTTGSHFLFKQAIVGHAKSVWKALPSTFGPRASCNIYVIIHQTFVRFIFFGNFFVLYMTHTSSWFAGKFSVSDKFVIPDSTSECLSTRWN